MAMLTGRRIQTSTCRTATLNMLKDQLIPAIWMTDTGGDWSTLNNWNSGRPRRFRRPKRRASSHRSEPKRFPRLACPGPPNGATAGSNDTVILDRPTANIAVTMSTGSSNIRKL